MGGVISALLLAMVLASECIAVRWDIFTPLFWFMTGVWALPQLSRLRSWFWPVLFVLLSVLQLSVAEWAFGTYFSIPITCLGIVTAWNVYDRIAGKNFSLHAHRWLSLACKFTFFIYLFHEPTLNIIRKALIVPLGRSSVGFAVNYLISPWIFVVAFIALGCILKRFFPKIYGICVGGR